VPNEHHHRLSRVAVLDSAILAIACLITFMLVTDLLPRVYHLSRAGRATRPRRRSPQPSSWSHRR
jgi:hypothetical protein